MSANTLEQRNSKVSVLRIDHAVKEVVPGTSSFSGRDPSLQGTEDAASAMRSTKEQRKGVEVHPAQITPKCTFKVIQKRRGPNSVASEGQSDQGGCADTMVVEKSVQEKVFSSEVDIGQLQEYEIPLIENGDGTVSLPTHYNLVRDPASGRTLLCVWSGDDEEGADNQGSGLSAVDSPDEIHENGMDDISFMPESVTKVTDKPLLNDRKTQAAIAPSADRKKKTGDPSSRREPQAVSQSHSVPSLVGKKKTGDPSSLRKQQAVSQFSSSSLDQGNKQPVDTSMELNPNAVEMRKARMQRQPKEKPKRQLTITSMLGRNSPKRAKPSVEVTMNDTSDEEAIDLNESTSDYRVPTLKPLKNTDSAVWKYFSKSKISSSCKLCPYTMPNKFPGNAKKHLRKYHKEQGQEVDQADELKNQAKHDQKQLTMMESWKGKNKYSHQHPKQRQFREALAWFAGCTTVSFGALQSPEFKQLILIVNPLLRIPATDTTKKDIESLFQKCVIAIKKAISEARKITISSDIWTKRGNRSSFLGITATFYHPVLKKKYHVVLAVKKFETVTHNSVDVMREMNAAIEKYDIPAVKVWSAMTDGGSNMVCSHRFDMQIFAKLRKGNSFECEDDQMDCDSEEDTNEEDETDDQNGGHDPDADYTEFDCEMPPFYEHLVCIIHSIIRCLKSIEELSDVKDIVDEVKVILGKFNKTPALCQELEQLTNLGLLNFPSTRWNYIYLTFERLLRVRGPLEKVLTDAGKIKYILKPEQWSRISALATILKPIHEFTSMASRVKVPASSEVIPKIINLQAHLRKNAVPNSFFQEVCDHLLIKLEKKMFKFMTDAVDDFKGTYMAATLLDPRYRIILSLEQQEMAKRYILQRFKQELEHSGYSLDDDSDERERLPTVPLDTECLDVAALKQTILESRRAPSSSQLHKFTTDLERYLQNLAYDEEPASEDPLKFWHSRRTEYNYLAPIALDYLCVPSSTADVERLFSRGGIATQGVRNRLDGKSLEFELFLSQNRSKIEELGVSLE